ncbi:MAG: hypothetical protein MJZ67_08660, partial [Bacteroidales bacterium]|nr:hypothetical protein [Bacteroidales bacterium]
MKKKTYPTPQDIAPASLVPNVLDNSSTPGLIAWDELAQRMRSDPALAEKIRYTRHHKALMDAETDEAEKARKRKIYDNRKRGCGAFIPAAQFGGGRKQEHLTRLTGVSMVDFDHVPADRMQPTLEAVRRDPHTMMAYITTSGEGIRILFCYQSGEPETAYLDAWLTGNRHYAKLTGIPHDEATKDPTRLSFLCFDAELYYNPQAMPFEVEVGICERIANEKRPARKSAKAEADNSPKRKRGRPRMTDREKLIAEAERLSLKGMEWREGNRHAILMSRAGILNMMGFGQQEIEDIVRPYCPRGDAEAAEIAQYAHEQGAAEFDTWDSHRPTANSQQRTASPEEIRKWLTEAERLRYNVVTAAVEVYSEVERKFMPMEDRTLNQLWHDCNVALGKYVRKTDFEAEINIEAVPAFHPMTSMVEGLPEWDGEDHILAFARRVRVKDGAQGLFEMCFRKWFVAMVAAWVEPTVLNHTILTLIGRQGIYKSTFFRTLLPPELSAYFMAKGNSSYISKDDKLAVATRALISLEEIDSMKDSDLNAVKALVTTERIDERAAYARTRQQHAHIASFCATGNNKQFLTDMTGNRRWLPFEVESIASPYDTPVDYAQLYAQAWALIGEGFQYWFSNEESTQMEAHLSLFEHPCVEAELIAKYYRHPQPLEMGVFYTASEVMARINVDVRGMMNVGRVGSALTRMGFKSKFIHGKKGYVLVERSFDEINHLQHEMAYEATNG